MNVLMVGYGGEGHDGAYLADSVRSSPIDLRRPTPRRRSRSRATSGSRSPASPNNGKVNEVFSVGHIDGGLDGAGALMAETLTAVTGLQIDHWISIDFGGFRDMVDAVGGVTIDNPVAFDYATHEDLHRAGIWDAGGFPAGEQHLNGEEALAYTARATRASSPSRATTRARFGRRASSPRCARSWGMAGSDQSCPAWA